MESAAERLMELLRSIEIRPPVIPVLNNVDVTSETAPDKIRDALKRQLCNPVRWVETIQKMRDQGIDRLIECGPGKVLVGLNKRIEKSMIAMPIFSPETIDEALV
jgi:[acyl-carrier-protein] S-malonyltransferase